MSVRQAHTYVCKAKNNPEIENINNANGANEWAPKIRKSSQKWNWAGRSREENIMNEKFIKYLTKI